MRAHIGGATPLSFVVTLFTRKKERIRIGLRQVDLHRKHTEVLQCGTMFKSRDTPLSFAMSAHMMSLPCLPSQPWREPDKRQRNRAVPMLRELPWPRLSLSQQTQCQQHKEHLSCLIFL